ncbi:hypothetical protein OSB04_022201 [Centaurea solstitialis]|uniref:WRKY domain-containing protein n=1 Tax=Centaurea solstitialis TaxID=347529 RepID=A0AA38SVX4_9ASTR|nr:hypothetical protein OSB04_022201 [Centaurea solstitialis]
MAILARNPPTFLLHHHSHRLPPPPPPPPQLNAREDQSSSYDDDGEEEDDFSFEKEVDDDTVGDLGRISSENRKLKEMLTIIWEHNNSLQNQVNKLMQDKQLSVSNPKKRKLDDRSSTINEQSSWKRPNDHEYSSNTGIRRVYVQTDPSDKTLVVKDDYQWRKYGQKVTRDNPSPRAYYKCSFAPSCPAKKKVQRSVDDAGVLVATYEGEHNHKSRKQEAMYVVANEYDHHKFSTKNRLFDEVLLQQMATYLGKDPNFTAQLAAAISTRILESDFNYNVNYHVRFNMCVVDIISAAKHFEQNRPTLIRGDNESFITFIPKVKDPLGLNNYRPIHHLRCVSKIISKVLAERLKLLRLCATVGAG